jgi:hypothetical protein
MQAGLDVLVVASIVTCNVPEKSRRDQFPSPEARYSVDAAAFPTVHPWPHDHDKLKGDDIPVQYRVSSLWWTDGNQPAQRNTS